MTTIRQIVRMSPGDSMGLAAERLVDPFDLDRFDPCPTMTLDPGIRYYVLVLRSQGIETFESCEGGEGHAFLEPTVRFHGNAFEGYRAFTAAMNFGLPVYSLRRFWSVEDGQLVGPQWEMTFRTAAPVSHA